MGLEEKQIEIIELLAEHEKEISRLSKIRGRFACHTDGEFFEV